jgi:hypothetical protein
MHQKNAGASGNADLKDFCKFIDSIPVAPTTFFNDLDIIVGSMLTLFGADERCFCAVFRPVDF